MPSDRPGSHRDRLLSAALTCLQDKGYARTTARDLVAASGTNLHSIGYHFGSKETLLDEALAECFRAWTARVEHAVGAAASGGPPQQLRAAMSAMIDSFAEMRPQIMACVEAFAPAMRSQTLRAKLAAGYEEARQAGVEMMTRVAAEAGLAPPDGVRTLVSVLIAISDGLMLQWLIDPDSVPDAARTMDALALLAPLTAAPPD